MEILKNKTILIGKEAGQGRLMIAININGNIKTTTIGNVGCVPNSVSRCKPQENIAHCKIDINEHGSMVITNLKPQNSTFVNNVEIISKKITKDSQVSLGYEKYPLDISSIFEATKKLFATKDLPPISIRHLEDVWDDYEKLLEGIKLKQQQRAKRNRYPIIIGSIGGLISGVLGFVAPAYAAFAGIATTACALAMHTKNLRETDTSAIEIKSAQKKLIDNYVTPCCSHYLGQQQYYAVQKNKTCPYCKREWKI